MSTSENLRDAVIHHATGVLCRAKGSMASSQLYEEILKNFDVTQSFFWSIMQCARFVVKRVGADGGNSVVVAKTSLRLCKEYWKGTCCEEKCEELHICKYHVYGNCRFGKNEFGKPCKRSHDIRCPHNRAVLQDCTLQDLPEQELFLLLLQNDPSLLPEVCRHYNRSGVPGGGCSLRDGCTNLHLCLHRVQDRCRFGPQCQRLHALDGGGLKLLGRWGLLAGDVVVRDLLVVYQNRHRLLAAAAPQASWEANAAQAPTQENLRPPEEFNAIREKRKQAKLRYGSSHPARVKMAAEGPSRSLTDPADAQPLRVSPLGVSDLRHKLSLPVTETDQRTSDENICLHFLLKRCRFEDQCMLVHFNMPYKWEVLKGGVWRDLRHMEDIELAFCDPEARKSPGSRPVDFLSMTQGRSRRPVRRLSTPSSVTLPTHCTLTTEWVWYYQDNLRCWVEYGQADRRQRTTSVTSRDLEQAYQKNPYHEVKLMRGFQKYLLSFKDMYQWNRQQKTRRRVRRRPRFLSAASVARLTAQ